MQNRLPISSVTRRPAIILTREAIKRDKLVYIAVANKKIKYPSGRWSRIVYIGTTEKGIQRIAGSGAHRAKTLLTEWGVKELKLYVVYTRKGKQGVVAVWEKLERALIQAFKDLHWAKPKLNQQGKNANWESYYKYFSRQKTRKVIEQFSDIW